jgi:hypothetical protein
MDIDTLIKYLDNPKHFFNCSKTEHLDIESISFKNDMDKNLLTFINETRTMMDKNKSVYDIHFIKQGDKYILEYRFFQKRSGGGYIGTKNIYISFIDKQILKEYLIKLQNNFTFIMGESY